MSNDDNEQPTFDRSNWPKGPWDDEPERLEWQHAGLACLMLRGPMGAWCGYVGVPASHMWHGQDYRRGAVALSVHGGITYSGESGGGIAITGNDDAWLFGFDTCHLYDYAPGLAAITRLGDGTYRDVHYVQEQTNSLAEQLAAVNTEHKPCTAPEGWHIGSITKRSATGLHYTIYLSPFMITAHATTKDGALTLTVHHATLESALAAVSEHERTYVPPPEPTASTESEVP